VEGYVDVIACVGAGFEATVAPLGTALTEDQLRMLWQMADEPILCFDGDEAGRKAARRAIETAKPHLVGGVSLRFALMPPGQDPDDFIRHNGSEAFEKILEAAMPLSHFVFAGEVDGVDLSTPEQRAALEKRLNEFAFSITDKTVARHYRDYFRLRLSELFWTSDGRKRNSQPSFARTPRLPERTIEKIIVGICVEEPSLFREQHEIIASIEFEDPRFMRFFGSLGKLLLDFGDVAVGDVYRELGEEFYEVLSETHGIPRRGRGRRPEPSKGEQLRLLFPAIRLQPSLEELAQTLHYFVLSHRLKRYEAELHGSVGLASDDSVLESRVRGLHEFRDMVTHSEKELDLVYQRLRFRPGNDNNLFGFKVLEGNMPWRAALRR
jgi:DNA primase